MDKRYRWGWPQPEGWQWLGETDNLDVALLAMQRPNIEAYDTVKDEWLAPEPPDEVLKESLVRRVLPYVVALIAVPAFVFLPLVVSSTVLFAVAAAMLFGCLVWVMLEITK